MDITPSPRLLQMLGEIEFEEWQCIAELVDNAFDNFLEIYRSGERWAGGFVVRVSLPTPEVPLDDATVLVEDTGSGMEKAQLQNAVRAGFSSNDRYTKLGLFGMGFNVATARLGSKTSVLTTTSDDSVWSGVDIDFAKLKTDFDAPEISEPKDYMNEHGTRIVISSLKPDRYQYLKQQHAALRNVLGRVYGYLLSNYPFELFVQGERVTPVRHCVWSDARSVALRVAGSQRQVHARQNIDINLTPVITCEDCGSNQVLVDNTPATSCDICGSNRVTKRERKIWGWLGVQRYLDQKNYGIDFIRNGRKILMSNRSLFEWKDLNDPASSALLEYPSNLAHQGGRIVGEIHIDHVPVTYAKDAFEYSDKSWKFMVEKLRGEGPILPNKAKALGYPENDTPVALLARAYARTDAGTACLIPGDGKQAIHQTSRQWGVKFAEGDKEYETDQIWWEAAVEHDKKLAEPVVVEPEKPVTVDPDPDIWEDEDENPSGQPETETDGPEPEPEKPAVDKTIDEKLTDLLAGARKNHSLSGEVHSPSTNQKANLEVYEASCKSKLRDASGNVTAVWLQRGKGNSYTAVLDVDHSLFSKVNRSQMQVLAEELARQFIVMSSSSLSFTFVLAELIEKNGLFFESLATPAKAKAEADDLCQEIKQLLITKATDYQDKLIFALSVSDQHAITDAMLSQNGVSEKIENLNAIEYASPITILRLFSLVPAAFMDDRVFNRTYEDLANPDLQFKAQAFIHAPLIDIVLGATTANGSSVQEAEHVLQSVRFLRAYLSQS